MKELWFNLVLLKFEHRCGLSQSMGSAVTVENNSEDEYPNHLDSDIHLHNTCEGDLNEDDSDIHLHNTCEGDLNEDDSDIDLHNTCEGDLNEDDSDIHLHNTCEGDLNEDGTLRDIREDSSNTDCVIERDISEGNDDCPSLNNKNRGYPIRSFDESDFYLFFCDESENSSQIEAFGLRTSTNDSDFAYIESYTGEDYIESYMEEYYIESDTEEDYIESDTEENYTQKESDTEEDYIESDTEENYTQKESDTEEDYIESDTEENYTQKESDTEEDYIERYIKEYYTQKESDTEADYIERYIKEYYTQKESDTEADYTQKESDTEEYYTQIESDTEADYIERYIEEYYTQKESDTEEDYTQKESDTEENYTQKESDTEENYTQIESDTEADYTQKESDIKEYYTQKESDTEADYTQKESDTEADYTQKESDTEENYTHKHKNLWVLCEECYTLNYKMFFKEKLDICEGCGSHLKMKSSESAFNPRENYTHRFKHLWVLCEECYTLNYKKFLKEKLYICEGCGSHLKMNSSERLKLLIDPDTWDPMNKRMASLDPIEFHSEDDPYIDRIKSYQKETGLTEAIQTGIGQLNGIPVAMGVMEFGFMGGSMGSVVGEKITRLIEYATNQSLPLIIVCASGGARMQEGSLSLMQMAKISSALYDFQTNQKLFYISILTSPTTGGVTASFGMLGDIVVAEPDAYIAFAGKRVIEELLNIEVPEGSQETEYLFEKGLFDLVVPRNTLKSVLNELFQVHGFFPLNQNPPTEH
nr:acetyl-CoA carboxylase carboxyltransferase beta [Leycesteria formosa]